MNRRSSISFLLLPLLWLGMASPAYAFWPFDGLLFEPSYQVMIEGMPAEQDEWFDTLLLENVEEERELSSDYELQHEADSVKQRISKALVAKGYYDADVEVKIDDETDPPTFAYSVESGERYHLSSVELEWSGSLSALPEGVSAPQLSAGDLVDNVQIVENASKLASEIASKACLLDIKMEPVFEKVKEEHAIRLIYVIDTGPPADFGALNIEGNPTVKNKVVLRKVNWQEGECFSRPKLQKTQTALIRTQLFATSQIDVAETPNENGRVPVTISLKERAHRTFSAGASYATDRGMGVKFGWEHRNFNGGAEKLDIDTIIAETEQSLGGTYRIPAFLNNPKYTLSLAGSAGQEETDSYSSRDIATSASLERRFTPELFGSLGVGYTLSRVTDVDGTEETFGLVTFPSFLDHDTRDDSIDPREGHHARYSITPAVDTLGVGSAFYKQQLDASTYFSSRDIAGEPVLALRGKIGAITGASRDGVPADMRYYPGGGGSVRGFSYQSLGPLANGEAIGGLSTLELSTELRIKFTETWGAAVFVDAGNAYEDDIPDFGEQLFVGGGLGVRYYSPYGVLRGDVAVPINDKNNREDSPFQIYVSIGQAF